MRPSEPETLCLEVDAPDGGAAEWVAAEAWASGASGVEEREGSGGRTLLLVYAPADQMAAVEEAAASVPGAVLAPPSAVDATDWSQAWREGLEPVHVGERLIVRPGWTSVSLEPGQVEVVVDPGQAFGIGGHVSTRLALEWIEQVAREEEAFGAETRILDVGSGTGVLALSALKLGAGRAVGFDLDPLAGAAALETAARNGLAGHFDGFVGEISVVVGQHFDWVFANLLKREMLPIADAIAGATRTEGHAIFSGLLAAEGDEVAAALCEVGFGSTRTRTGVDSNGDDWVSLLMTRA